jgi:hypothetical protein
MDTYSYTITIWSVNRSYIITQSVPVSVNDLVSEAIREQRRFFASAYMATLFSDHFGSKAINDKQLSFT